jgi:serpin B
MLTWNEKSAAPANDEALDSAILAAGMLSMTRRECISRLPVGLALARSIYSQMTDDEKLIDAAKIAVAAQRTFGLALLRDVAVRKPAQNVFLSPLSVFLALHMTENGSAGATRTAMRKALALPDRKSVV